MNYEERVVFTAEASGLGWPPGSHQDSFVVYGDTFRFEKAVHDNEGDTLYWQYRCRRTAEVARIFND
jgi:hypothetical protein